MNIHQNIFFDKKDKVVNSFLKDNFLIYSQNNWIQQKTIQKQMKDFEYSCDIL